MGFYPDMVRKTAGGQERAVPSPSPSALLSGRSVASPLVRDVRAGAGASSAGNGNTATAADADTVYQDDRKVFEVPAGCIDKVLVLGCKSPTEAKFYDFSLKNRMLPDDTIGGVSVRASAESGVEADRITFVEQTFRVRLKGGTIFTNVSLQCQATTAAGETLDFVCVLPIRPEGLPANGVEVVMVMGPAGTGIGSIAQKPDGTLVFTMTDGTVREVSAGHEQARSLPSDFTTNGGVYVAPDDYVTGNKPMPAGLSLNGNLVMTDGSVPYQGTTDNGGLLCAG